MSIIKLEPGESYKKITNIGDCTVYLDTDLLEATSEGDGKVSVKEYE